MYAEHMPRIAAHGLASPSGLVDVVAFVLCTIQQPFSQMAKQMALVREHGEHAVCLFGSKRDGYRYVVEHASVLHAAIVEAKRTSDVIAAVDVLSLIPGLGVVKAGFVAQCLGFEVACLDTHNLRRLGLPIDALKLSKSLKPDTRRAKIVAYVDLCKRTGGAQYWWNTWCAYVVGRRNKFASAMEVSAFQCVALGLS